MPDPKPPAGHERFLDVELPEHFIVEVVTDRGEWLDGNGYLAQDCSRLDDGSYALREMTVAFGVKCAELRKAVADTKAHG